MFLCLLLIGAPVSCLAGLLLNLALVDLSGNFFGVFYIHIYDPLVVLKAIEINQMQQRPTVRLHFSK